MKQRSWTRRALAACILALASPYAAAFTYQMPSDALLLEQADGVAVVRVREAAPAADGDRETLYRVEPLRIVAGPALGREARLALPGTHSAPGRNWHVPGVPRLAPGAVALVFYRERGDGALQPVQLSLGLFGLVDDGRHYVRDLEGAQEIGKRATVRRYHAPRAAQAFEAWIADRARGRVREADYLRDGLTVAPEAKFTLQMHLGIPARWFQFDGGQSMPWRADAGGQAGATADEFASVQQALAAWTDDYNSRILLNYAGTADTVPACASPAGVGAEPFDGHVCWNDPNNEIAGSYACNGGGVLAIGGSFFSLAAQSFNGTDYYPRSDASVVVQDGTACFFDRNGGREGAEVLTHEIGHTLGFGHACGDGSSPACNTDPALDDATMRASAHGDGRGAVLGDDDRAAARQVYPRPGGIDLDAPGAPAALLANATNTTISLAWTPAIDAASGVAGYRIERCAGAACANFTQVATSALPAHDDAALVPMTLFRYRVRAVDVAGNAGPYSNVAEATTGAQIVVPLVDGVPVAGLSGAQDSERLFSIAVPAGATRLRVTLAGNNGDADLYVRRGSHPSTAAFTCRSWEFGSNEVCTIESPQADTWFVLVRGFESYANATLLADVDAPVACTGDCVFRNGFE